jgi:uncharacterized repeat protein (TIGR01451 family)
VGDQLTFDLTVSNNGECIAAATIVTNQLPAGLGLVGVSFNQGIGTEYNPVDRTIIWRVGSVVSGGENNAILSVTVKALQPGDFQNSACAEANYDQLHGPKCTDFSLHIDGVASVTPPKLALQLGPLGRYQLQLTGQQGSAYQIQTSPDLYHWLNWTNAPGPIFSIELPEIGLPANKAKFYRAY